MTTKAERLTRRKTIEMLKLLIEVIERDIQEGKCGLPGLCMEKVAIERALRLLDPAGGDHKVRIDTGCIKFNLYGYRWVAMTPKAPRRALVQFDKEAPARKRAEKLGLPFVSKVKPHKWTMEAVKSSKIIPMTQERLEQIYAARRIRVAEGRVSARYDLKKRIVGSAGI